MEQTDINEREAYVQNNYPYYEKEWRRIDKGEFSFNLAAFFLPIIWLGYRKIYRPIIVIALVYLIITILNITEAPSTWLRVIDSFYTLMISFFFGFQGNKLYKKEADTQIERVKRVSTNIEEKKKTLNKKGGISALGIVFAVLLVICVYTIPMIIIDFTLL